jgi:hypothetical protein
VQQCFRIVDAHLHPHHEVRALLLAEQVARRELGAPSDVLDVAAELGADPVGAHARSIADVDAGELRLRHEDVRVRAPRLRQREHRRAGSHEFA